MLGWWFTWTNDHRTNILYFRLTEFKYSLDLYYFKQTISIEYSIGCKWTGTTIAETLECCSSENGSQCGIQEGNCYSDDECFWHLKCGTRNCQDQNPFSDFPIGSNCCYDPIPSKM